MSLPKVFSYKCKDCEAILELSNILPKTEKEILKKKFQKQHSRMHKKVTPVGVYWPLQANVTGRLTTGGSALTFDSLNDMAKAATYSEQFWGEIQK